jgi:hypothetical protein
MLKRLYVVVRQDLDPGYQIAQSLHAFREFVHFFPDIELDWYKTSNTIIVKGIQDERELLGLAKSALATGIKFATFREPDMGDQITSIAFEPGEATAEFLSHLNLACSDLRTKTGTPKCVPTESC